MSTRMGWIVGAVCLMIAGFAVLPAPAQDPKGLRPPAGEVRSDKPEGSKKKDLDASRERLRAAYRSGDPAAIKAARENYQKLRSEAKERSGTASVTR
jgi:hypothetical protein